MSAIMNDSVLHTIEQIEAFLTGIATVVARAVAPTESLGHTSIAPYT